MDNVSFIMAAEDGTLTEEDFANHAQAFVDSGVWRHLQGSWQRTVCDWINQGIVNPPGHGGSGTTNPA